MPRFEAPRIGAMVFVCVALLFVFVAGVYACFGGWPRWYTASRARFWCAAGVQAVLLGFVVGLWLHLVPCFWLACDLGPEDEPMMRGLLWFVSWPVIALLLLLSCAGERDCGLVWRRRHTALTMETTSRGPRV
jgi:hypothetical protein